MLTNNTNNNNNNGKQMRQQAKHFHCLFALLTNCANVALPQIVVRVEVRVEVEVEIEVVAVVPIPMTLRQMVGFSSQSQ